MANPAILARAATVCFITTGSILCGLELPVKSVTLKSIVVGPVGYTINGATPASVSISIPRFFNLAGVPSSNLSAVKLSSATTGAFSGTALLINAGSGTTSYSFTSSPSFTFSNGSILSGAAQPGSLSPSSLAPGAPNTSASLSGSYSGSGYSGSSITVDNQALIDYFTGTGSSSGNPVITTAFAGYAASYAPPGDGASNFNNAIFSGNLYVAYEYVDVPAPSAIAGAAAAFAYTRRMKDQSKRIRCLSKSFKV
jgi:hypothetical protein